MNKDELLEIIMKCNRCGACQEVCPTYKTSHEEFQLARGRNRLIRMVLEGKLCLDEEPELFKFLDECLLCGACEANCPAGVPTPQIILAMRKEYTKSKGLPLPKKVLCRNVFSDNKKINNVRKMLRIYQKSGTSQVVKAAGAFKSLDSRLPDMPRENIRKSLPKILSKPLRPKKTVAYFLGCSVNNFFPHVAESTIKVLQENNYEVIVPETNCCGAPHNSSGDHEEYMRIAKENIEILSSISVEEIIVDCATCGSMLKEYTEAFKDDPVYSKIAQEVSEKVIDISTFLLKNGYKSPKGEVRKKVTYHDPCHAVRGLKVKKAPRLILQSIPGIEFVEMKDADTCCGGAGSYGVFHPKQSKRILDNKINNFKDTGASILATSCPSCTMQITSGLRLKKVLGEVKHPIELLALAYEKGDESK